jgi:hypothetical protein
VGYLGAAFVVLLLVLHLLRVERPVAEIKLITTVALLGGLWDSALIYFAMLDYPHSTVFHGIAPLWLVSLWGLFAAQFNTTYRWLKHRLAAGALLGAVAGPLSFRSGAALGALHFVQVWPATVSLAIGWALLLPLIILLSRHWDGVNDVR